MRYLLSGLLALSLFLAGCGRSEDPGGQVTTVTDPTTTPAPSTTTSEAATTSSAPTTQTTATVPPTGWQIVELDPATFGPGTGIGNVAFRPDDNSWVAVGTVIPAEFLDEAPRSYCFESGLCPTRVWDSPDGATWTLALELEPGPYVTDLTDVRGAPGPLYPTMLAVGAEYDESVFPARPVPAVWHLEVAGTPTVTRVVDDDLDSVAGKINGIAGVPFGYAAVGWTCPDDTPECLAFANERQPTIWISEDGYDWQVVATVGAVVPGELNDVVGLWFAEPPGWVAVGGDWNRAFAARGSPGGEWTFVELPSNTNPSIEYELEDGSLGTMTGPCSGTGRAVTAGRDGTLVAVGPCVPLEAHEAYATSWVSSDGFNWTQSTASDGLELPAWMRTVAWTGSEYLAGGWRNSIPVVWTSPDGWTWSALEISEEPGGAHDIGVGEGRQIAVGGWDSALIWIR